MSTGIYEIVHAASGKRYVGSAVNMRLRWHRHRHELRRGEHGNQRLQRSWAKYGEAAFTFRAILQCSPRDLIFYEQRCIDGFAPEYNICRVAGSGLGTKRSEATRSRMSAARRGKGAGVKMTDECKAKISAALRCRKKSERHRESLRSRVFSPEHRANISQSLKGHGFSEGQLLKMRAAKVGKKLSAEHVANAVAARAGYRHSDATIERIRQAQKGRALSPEHRAAPVVGQRKRREREAEIKRGPQ